MDHTGPMAVGHAVQDLLDAVAGILLAVVLAGNNVVKQLTTRHTGEGGGRGEGRGASRYDEEVTNTFTSQSSHDSHQHTHGLL